MKPNPLLRLIPATQAKMGAKIDRWLRGLHYERAKLRRELGHHRQILHALFVGDATPDDLARFYCGEVGNVPLSANQGGCWFCGRSDANSFCLGWDTYYHQECLDRERVEHPDNPELTEFP